MSSLDKALKNLKFDARMVEQNINNGTLTKEELKKHLESLPDLSAQAEPIDLDRKERAEQH